MATAELPEGRVEALEQVVTYLVMERQRLRHEDADGVTLEANRRALVATQARLGRALADEYTRRRLNNGRRSPDQQEPTAR